MLLSADTARFESWHSYSYRVFASVFMSASVACLFFHLSLVTCRCQAGYLHVWDVRSLTCVQTLRLGGSYPLSGLALLPPHGRIAVTARSLALLDEFVVDSL